MFYQVLLLLFYAHANCEDAEQPKLVIERARIDTCAGCKLYDLPDLKEFIFEDFPQYANTELKLKPGFDPVLHFLTKDGQTVESLFLTPLSREACNDLLKKHGFVRKSDKTEL
ncbi:hypothetical protein PPYR_00261 [Photinus pyralis]|nr:selenoprotein M-like [Photinus pyralis]XP_031329370.1 selenoprotein M-like [Photinus pyralis]KAB0803290.1 hypothetical protein PPYR_00260 [Photinus pyralis]KAB0803291.1 hypothetical protein PPYR_00261 [Photinus pyralis]